MARLVFDEKTRSDDVKRYKIKHKNSWRQVSLNLTTEVKQWWEDPDVVVAFNFPRISARLERLMGTNTVRLTDNKYMKELRKRIDNDYIEELMKRIKTRELKEIERERLLIIEGKSDDIPAELVNDPIFVVNKAANIEIQKTRAKLKTNREKNSERLKQQGVKWERERLVHEEEERQHLQNVRERRRNQKLLEERYKEEDEDRGMDLLRIENEDWRECEQKLREFLEEERAKMKARSLKVPTPFTSDPLDMQNVRRAKLKFKETQKRIQDELEKEGQKLLQAELEKKALVATEQRNKFDETEVDEFVQFLYGAEDKGPESQKDQKEFDLILHEDPIGGKRLTDASDDDGFSDTERSEGSTISVAKAHHSQMLKEEIEEDVQRGLLISHEQYQHLRFEDVKILQLRNANDMRKLYQLAEEIIIGERVPEEIVEEVVEEPVEELDEEAEEEESSDF